MVGPGSAPSTPPEDVERPAQAEPANGEPDGGVGAVGHAARGRDLGGDERVRDPPRPPMPPEEVAEAVRGLPQPSRLVRFLPFLGAFLAVVGAFALWGVWEERPGQVKAILTGIGILFTAGKEAAIPAAVFGAGELFVGEPADPWLVGGFVWLADVAAVAMLYALVHRILDGVQSRATFLGRMLRTAQLRADKRRKVVDRYGPFGLFVFLIIPFAFNSPVVGIVLGRAAGMRPTQIAPVLLAAITTTALGWTVLCAYGKRLVPPAYAWLPMVLSLAITAAVLGGGFLADLRRKWRERRERREPDEP